MKIGQLQAQPTETGFPRPQGAAEAWQAALESGEPKDALGAAGVGEESVTL